MWQCWLRLAGELSNVGTFPQHQGKCASGNPETNKSIPQVLSGEISKQEKQG